VATRTKIINLPADVIETGRAEFKELRLHVSTEPPENPEIGQVYWDSTKGKLGVYTGSDWIYLSFERQEKMYGFVGDGTNNWVDLGEEFVPESTRLIVNHSQWYLRTKATESPDIWEYEESDDHQKIRPRYRIHTGAPCVVYYLPAAS